jgi:hypothetical protein
MNSKTVYVIMPVSATVSHSEQEWADIFSEVFSPVFRDCGYVCERAFPSSGNLIKSIITQLRTSWLVLADLTDRNANVFYELGVRHSLSKRTILVSQDPTHIPSDLLGHWWLPYGIALRERRMFREQMTKLIKQIEADPERSDSPVADFLEKELISVSAYMARDNAKKISALVLELSGIKNTVGMVRTDVKYVAFLRTPCLEMLLNTLYIDVGPDTLRQCHQLHHSLEAYCSGINRSAQWIDQIEILLTNVQSRIATVMDLLIRNEFAEPVAVSRLLWEAIPIYQGEPNQIQEPDGLYSVPTELTESDLSDLQDHFNDRDELRREDG